MTHYSSTKEIKIVKIGIYEDEPFIFTDEKGTVKGICADILNHIAEKENWDINYVKKPWGESILDLEKGKIDIMTAIAYSEPRAKRFNYTDETVLSNWRRVYGSDIQSFLDSKREKIAVLKDDIYYTGPMGIKILTERFDINCSFVEVEEYIDIPKLVQAEKVDAGVVPRLYGRNYLERFEIKETPVVFSPTELKIALSKNSSIAPLLKNKLDFYLNELKEDEDSIYYQSLEEHIGGYMSDEEGKTTKIIPDWIKTLLTGVGLISLFLGRVVVLSRVQVKRRTEDLKNSKERFKNIYHNVNGAIIIQNPDTRKILDVNEKMCEMFGYDKDEAVELSIEDLSAGDPPFTRYEADKIIQKAAEGEAQKFEWKTKDKNGRIFWIEVNIRKATIDERELLLVLVRDIDERKQAEERKSFLNNLLRQDLSSKNQIIAGYLNLLEDSKLSEEQMKFVKNALKNARDEDEIISEDDELSEMDKFKDLQRVDIIEALDHSIKNEEYNHTVKNINIEKNFPTKIGKVKGDYSIKKLFSYILKARASNTGSNTIKIDVSENDDEVLVSFQDDGEKIHDDIKDLFSGQIYNGKTAGIAGFRYYIIAEVVKHNKGRIEIKDSELGGARLDIYFKKESSSE